MEELLNWGKEICMHEANIYLKKIDASIEISISKNPIARFVIAARVSVSRDAKKRCGVQDYL